MCLETQKEGKKSTPKGREAEVTSTVFNSRWELHLYCKALTGKFATLQQVCGTDNPLRPNGREWQSAK